MSARVIQVIETVTLKGLGIPGDPCRNVTEYWTLDGKLLAGSEMVKTTSTPVENVKVIGGVRRGPDTIELDQP